MRIKKIIIREETSCVFYEAGEDSVSFKSPHLDVEPLFRRFKHKHLLENFRSWYVKDFTAYYDRHTQKVARCVIGVSMTRGEGKTVFRQEIANPDQPITEEFLDAMQKVVKASVKLHLSGL